MLKFTETIQLGLQHNIANTLVELVTLYQAQLRILVPKIASVLIEKFIRLAWLAQS
jgi:hypothetical protein